MEPTPTVLALVRDLMFVSRITATAREVGCPVAVVRNPKDLPDREGSLLLADLNLEGAIEAAAAWKQSHNAPVIGFVSHTDAATIARAREAGIDRVMARGGFVEALPSLLKDPDVR
jgi:hypothetical protein